MKTLNVTLVPQRWTEVLAWLAAGDEVQLTESEKIVATLVPAETRIVPPPDFVSRAKKIWGDSPEGEQLSQLVSEAR